MKNIGIDDKIEIVGSSAIGGMNKTYEARLLNIIPWYLSWNYGKPGSKVRLIFFGTQSDFDRLDAEQKAIRSIFVTEDEYNRVRGLMPVRITHKPVRRATKKLAYMSETFTRVLQITDAPRPVKSRMVGRYLTTCNKYMYPAPFRKADLWTSANFDDAYQYEENLKSFDKMKEYQDVLKHHGVKTSILIVRKNISVIDFGKSTDFDGDQIQFYFTGIDKNGNQTFLRLLPPEMARLTLFPSSTKDFDKVYPWKVGDQYMTWSAQPNDAWMTRYLPDEELIDNVNAFAEKSNVTSLMVGRIYR